MFKTKHFLHQSINSFKKTFLEILLIDMVICSMWPDIRPDIHAAILSIRYPARQIRYPAGYPASQIRYPAGYPASRIRPDIEYKKGQISGASL
jgi:hypothetical protein